MNVPVFLTFWPDDRFPNNGVNAGKLSIVQDGVVQGGLHILTHLGAQ